MGRNRKFSNDEKELEKMMLIDNNAETITIKKDLEQIIPYNIKIKAKNDKQKDLINTIRNNEIIFCSGPPGTGKSFVALAYAINLLRKQQNNYKKIYLLKSVLTLKGEELGYIKGDINEKLEAPMWSYMINMEKIIPVNIMKILIEKGYIIPFPIAYMRGVSIDNAIIILDEAQNITIDNSRTILTRIGNNSKLIILGDIKQVDLKKKSESSLIKLIELFKDTDKFGVVKMEDNDTENVRNPLISIIEDKFNNFYEKNK